MKRTPLRPRSHKTEQWTRRYLKEKAFRIASGQGCQVCKADCGRLHGHHYSGSRRNENILRFLICGERCHAWIHAHPSMAREMGLLALVNGTYDQPHPAVAWAEARFVELMRGNAT